MHVRSLKTQLVITGILLSSIPLILLGIWTSFSTVKLNTSVKRQAEAESRDKIATLAISISRVAKSLQEINISQSGVAFELLKSEGGIHEHEGEKVDWTATNQFDQRSVSVSLPKLYLGDSTWLGQISDPTTPVPLVDKIESITHQTVTIFERLNDQGDMLRVATTLHVKDGNRAIGTYIPVTMPDGNPNPVLDKVLQGEIFSGRVRVLDQWYIAVYRPLVNQQGIVYGMLFTGLPEKQATQALREIILETKIGKSGYIYVLNAKGADQGRYVISKDGKRDGENILLTQDTNGHPFIQEITEKALLLKPGEFASAEYPWQNKGEATPRLKIVNYTYFEPWDWVIGASVYKDELFASANELTQASRKAVYSQILAIFISVSLSVVVWIWKGNSISSRVLSAAHHLLSCAESSGVSSHQMAASSNRISSGASEQAASLEETSASMEEMESMLRRNADASVRARTLSHESRFAANSASERMKELRQATDLATIAASEMNGAVDSIQQSSSSIAKINKSIDEIAFQTNILALNAAIEAARAGEYGQGFAVVADEVRNLAKRSADAARETSILIEESIARSLQGVQSNVKVSESLREILERAGLVETGLTTITHDIEKLDESIEEIATATIQQRDGVAQVNSALSQLNQVTQITASNASEGLTVANKLQAQADELKEIVTELIVVIEGNSSSTALSATTPKSAALRILK